MKKIVAFVLTLVLLCGFTAALADTDFALQLFLDSCFVKNEINFTEEFTGETIPNNCSMFYFIDDYLVVEYVDGDGNVYTYMEDNAEFGDITIQALNMFKDDCYAVGFVYLSDLAYEYWTYSPLEEVDIAIHDWDEFIEELTADMNRILQLS